MMGKKKGILFGVLILFSLTFISSFNFEGDGVKIISPVDEYGVEVSIQDYNGETISLFISRMLQLTNLTSNLSIGNKTAYVYNSTNCLVGDAIDIYDNDRYFQGIITGVSGNAINFTPEIDRNYFKNDTVIKCGEWNMNANGAITPINYYLNPPMNKAWDIESIAMQFIDNADWDINTFGSRTALSNGFTVSIGDGQPKELFLIYNNGGFTLRGGEIQNFDKSPSGSYGFGVDMMFEPKYGAVLKIDGKNNEKIIATIRDDLTSQEQIAFVVRGHYKDE